LSVLLVLIAASLFVATGFLLAFIWAVRSGQYEDRETPAFRILWDDKPANNDKSNNTSNH
jgi:cbb3-type cytochrome oxidase maturation protein